jgi:hypothetical protein
MSLGLVPAFIAELALASDRFDNRFSTSEECSVRHCDGEIGQGRINAFIGCAAVLGNDRPKIDRQRVVYHDAIVILRFIKRTALRIRPLK